MDNSSIDFCELISLSFTIGCRILYLRQYAYLRSSLPFHTLLGDRFQSHTCHKYIFEAFCPVVALARHLPAAL
jgi:hypothetical protein